MSKLLTKEEFLDKKNIELIKKVSAAMNLKSEIDVLTAYLLKKEKDGLMMCRLIRRKVAGIYPKYHIHDTFLRLIEALDRRELIFKDDIKLGDLYDSNAKAGKEIMDSLQKQQGFKMYFTDKEGNLYDDQINPIDNIPNNKS